MTIDITYLGTVHTEHKYTSRTKRIISKIFNMNAAVRTRTCKPRTSRTSGVSGTPGTLCSHDKMAQHADKPGTTYK